ncbi:hypothetical protein E4V99_12375 [Microbacterium sp. dk485]|uniref:hypothetical protein n=1 Tax=Microbacterium TaxID=33882 RepID=UPI001073BD2D|nr:MULTISPECIES: hypothetical protein [Microbacterium]TFV81759.1 hypothetical protein E4V99_12375 [Microbacterium sp. dk485]TXK10855.1 hypothetical protein FVP99_16190 [Microbacterium wangchenii]
MAAQECEFCHAELDSSDRFCAACLLPVAPSHPASVALRVDPAEIRLDAGEQRCSLQLFVDNNDAVEPLHIWLAGESDDRAVLLRFDPDEVVVPAQATATVGVAVRAPRPRAAGSLTRQLLFTARDGWREITVSATLVQSTPDWRPAVRIVLVLFGFLFVVLGSFMPWIQGSATALLTTQAIRDVFSDPDGVLQWQRLIEPLARIVVLILAVLMVVGLRRRARTLMRESAVLIALLTAGLVISAAIAGGYPGPSYGALFVWFGALLGYIGAALAVSPRRPRDGGRFEADRDQ